MYLIDTSVIAMLDPRHHAVAPNVTAWLKHNGASVFLSVMTITEMDAGFLKLRRERKIERANEIGALVTAILTDFADRVLAIDLETARHIARLGELTYRQPVALPDLIIAATAARHGLTVLTRNISDFGRLDVTVRNPFAELPPDL
jgi:toxin FitB